MVWLLGRENAFPAAPAARPAARILGNLPNMWSWMVQAVVHIQQYINKRKVRYQPFGLWGQFPNRIFCTKPCTLDDDSSSSSDSDSDSETPSGSSLTSCSADYVCSDVDYSPDDIVVSD